MPNDMSVQIERTHALVFAPAHSRALGERVAAALGVALAASEEREFEGGEHKMRSLVDVGGCSVYVVQSLCGDARASANDKLCRLLFFIGALKDAGAARVTACVPYLAYARKDRRTQPRDPVTTRYVAALFEAVGVDEVVVLDVHNEAAFDNAFRCRTTRIEGAAVFADALGAHVDAARCAVASPDLGGVKRAQRLREQLAERFATDLGFAFMEKRRARGVVSGEMLVGDVMARDVVIHDDMIVSGGTIRRATLAARAAGARRIIVVATHAAFTSSAAQLFETDGPDLVLVSDSIELREPFSRYRGNRLQVCSIAPAVAECVRSDRTHA